MNLKILVPVVAVAIVILPFQDAGQHANAQGTSRVVDQATAQAILRCYHRTGLFERAVEISESEIARRGRWGKLPDSVSAPALRERYEAETIRFIRLYWRGAATGSAYQTDVALMTRSRAANPEMRTAVLADTSALPTIARLCRTEMGWEPDNTAKGMPL